MVARPLLKPSFAEAQTVKPISTMRTVAAVEAQIVMPTRQPLKLIRLALFRARPHCVAVILGVSGNFDDSSNGAVPDRMTGALRLQRIVEQGHNYDLCKGKKHSPCYVRHLKVVSRGQGPSILVGIRRLRRKPTARSRIDWGLHG